MTVGTTLALKLSKQTSIAQPTTPPATKNALTPTAKEPLRPPEKPTTQLVKIPRPEFQTKVPLLKVSSDEISLEINLPSTNEVLKGKGRPSSFIDKLIGKIHAAENLTAPVYGTMYTLADFDFAKQIAQAFNLRLPEESTPPVAKSRFEWDFEENPKQRLRISGAGYTYQVMDPTYGTGRYEGDLPTDEQIWEFAEDALKSRGLWQDDMDISRSIVQRGFIGYHPGENPREYTLANIYIPRKINDFSVYASNAAVDTNLQFGVGGILRSADNQYHLKEVDSVGGYPVKDIGVAFQELKDGSARLACIGGFEDRAKINEMLCRYLHWYSEVLTSNVELKNIRIDDISFAYIYEPESVYKTVGGSVVIPGEGSWLVKDTPDYYYPIYVFSGTALLNFTGDPNEIDTDLYTTHKEKYDGKETRFTAVVPALLDEYIEETPSD